MKCIDFQYLFKGRTIILLIRICDILCLNYFIEHVLFIMHDQFIHQQFSMVNLIVLILLINIARSQETLTDCFHNQKFKIVNTTAFLPQTGGYAYNIPWTQAQGNITQYSVTLVGFFNTGVYNQQAFNANLASVSSTHGSFIFDPQTLSSIVNIQFSIILIGTCSGYIELKYIEYVPVQFNVAAASRVQNISVYNVTLSRAFTADVTNYKAFTFISAFYLTQVGSGNFSLMLQTTQMSPLSIIHQIHAVSMANIQNRYQKICFTYLLIYLPLFQEEVSYYFNYYSIMPSSTAENVAINPNFDIPQVFNPNLTTKCIISICYLKTQKLNSDTQINFADLGTTALSSITYVTHKRIFEVFYQIFCIQQCSQGASIDKNFSTYLCTKCNNTLPYCEKCYYGDLITTFNILTVNMINNATAVNKTLYCKKCQTNYYLYSVDNTCYSVCPMGTFASNNTGTCLYCNSACKSCADNMNCLSCKIGWPVEGGCTILDGCIKAISPIICSKCTNKLNFVLVRGTCTCVIGYYLVSHLCVNVFGCIGAIISGNSTACILCNSYIGLMIDNGLCRCKDDYYFGSTRCKQICGDGKLYQYQCDDGNTVNGDGCSSACTVQTNYQCSGGSKNSSSKCIYFKSDINLTVLDIQKADLYNKGIFTVKISPQTGNIGLLNFSQAVQFQCNQSISIEEISYSNSQLVIIVQYFQDLEGFLANITLNFDRKYYLQSSAKLTFNMTSNGNKLIRISNLAFIKSMSIVLSLAALIVFALSLTVHKMIGVELLISFQIVYLIHLVNNQYTQQYALLKYLSYTSWNFLGMFQGSANVNTISLNESFDSASQFFALKIMIGVSFAVFAVLITVLAVKAVKLLRNPALSTKAFTKTMLFLYNQILFPITIGFSFVFLVIINTLRLKEDIDIPYHIKFIQPLFTIFLGLLFFFEWKAILISNLEDPYVGVDKCQKSYIAFFLTVFLVVIMIISFSCYHPQFDPTIPSLGLELFLFFWLIAYRPYVGTVHNVGVIINLLPSIAFLTWNVLRQKLKLSQNRQLQFLLIFALLVIFSVSIAISALRIIYQICLIRQEKKAAIAYKLQKQISQKRMIDELCRIEERRIETDLDASQLQPFKRPQGLYINQILNVSNIKFIGQDSNGRSSPTSYNRIKNRLRQSDYEASRRRLLHHLA